MARVRGPSAAPRRICVPLLQATVINVFYEVSNLTRGQVTAHITPKT